MDLENGRVYPTIVTDYYGSYGTHARYLGKGDCARQCDVFVYAVAEENESKIANEESPITVGLAGVEELLFDDEGIIMINEKDNVMCYEKSSRETTPRRYAELLNKFRGTSQ